MDKQEFVQKCVIEITSAQISGRQYGVWDLLHNETQIANNINLANMIANKLYKNEQANG